MILALALAGALHSEACADCHPEQAARFDASRHARAAALAVFRAPLRHASRGWCLSCHRPEGAAAPQGLQCLSCHRAPGDAGAVLATRAGSPRALRAHRVVMDPSLAREGCARCHEFAAPLPGHLDPVVYSTQPLQATVSELRRQDPAALCSGCHDPHAAPGAHDEATLRSALRIAAQATSDGVAVQVTARGVGHRFPTGDPFRRLTVAVCDDEDCATPLAQTTIARGFARVGPVWAPVIDRSLREGETRVLRFPKARYYRAWFSYGDPRFEGLLPPSEVAVELQRGAVPPAAER